MARQQGQGQGGGKVTCPRAGCGKENSGSHLFCVECGEPLRARCQSCGNTGGVADKKCGMCGGEMKPIKMLPVALAASVPQGKDVWKLDVNVTHNYGDGRYDFRVMLSKNGQPVPQKQVIVLGIQPPPIAGVVGSRGDSCTAVKGEITDNKIITLEGDGCAVITIKVDGRRRDLDFSCPAGGVEANKTIHLHGVYQVKRGAGFWANFFGMYKFNKGR